MIKEEIIDHVRKGLDMTNDKDVEVWDTLMDIASTPTETLLLEFGDELRKDLAELEEQIALYEKIRLKHLNDKVLRKQAAGILIGLRREADELRQIAGNKAYQRVDTTTRRRAV